jgi:hypothetical protein
LKGTKWILAALCALPFTAVAQTWSASNEGGGEIVLTLRQNKCKEFGKNLVDGYSYGSSGRMFEFCWAVVDDMIRVVYLHDSTVRVYKPEIFSKKTDK